LLHTLGRFLSQRLPEAERGSGVALELQE